MSEYRLSAGLARGLLQYAAAKEIDTQSLCDQVGIEPDSLSDPDAHIPYTLGLELFLAVAKACDDPDFGLHLGEYRDATKFGILSSRATAARGATRLGESTMSQ